MKKKTLLLSLLLAIFCFSAVNSQQVVEVITGNVGKNKKLTKPGIYQIKGKVIGNIEINPSSGKIILEGFNENAWLQGIPWGGNTRRHVSHFAGTIDGGEEVIVRNLIIKGDGHNAMEFNGNGKKLITNVTVINNDTVIDGKHFPKVGSINAGPNSTIDNCLIHTGDDAIKITAPNSRGYNSTVYMTGNGSAIQFGWEKRANGAKHYADNIDVYGFTGVNPNHDNPNTDDNPGRSVIGGMFSNNVSDVQITNLRVHGTNFARVLKIVAKGSTLSDVTIKVDAMDGLATHQDSKGRTWYPIVLVAKNGGQIKNLTVDFGGVDLTDPAVRQQYVSITGGNNIDVTWKTHPIDNEPIPDITDLTADAVNCSTVVLNWSDVNGESGYRIRRRVVGGTYVTLADVAANTTTYTDNTAQESTSYEYMVRPLDGATAVAVSNVPQVTTPPCGNIPPIADAGLDQNVTDADENGSETVTLNGSGSEDIDGSIVSYIWTKDGVEVGTGVSTDVTLDVGEHLITLTVTDNEGDSDSDDVIVTVEEVLDLITVNNIRTDCNASGKARNVINFSVNGSSSTPTVNRGSVIADGTNWKIKEVGVPYSTTLNYNITVDGVTETVPVTSVNSNCQPSLPIFTITATATGDGTISPAGDISVTQGGSQTFTISEGDCGVLSDVLVNGVSVGVVPTYNFENVQSDQTIEAVFVPSPINFTISISNSSCCSVMGDGTVECGGTQIITITPDPGCEIVDVIIDGVSQGPISSYTFSNITSDHVVEVFCQEIPDSPITINNVVTDCNNSGKARNVIYFSVVGTSSTPTVSSGTLLNDGGGNYRLRDVGVNFGSTKTYTITVDGQSESETVTAVSSCPKAASGLTASFNADIYPNPSDGNINIALQSNEPASVTIMNITGMQVYSANIENGITSIDMTEFGKGLYIVRLYTSIKTWQKQIIVQ